MFKKSPLNKLLKIIHESLKKDEWIITKDSSTELAFYAENTLLGIKIHTKEGNIRILNPTVVNSYIDNLRTYFIGRTIINKYYSKEENSKYKNILDYCEIYNPKNKHKFFITYTYNDDPDKIIKTVVGDLPCICKKVPEHKRIYFVLRSAEDITFIKMKQDTTHNYKFTFLNQG